MIQVTLRQQGEKLGVEISGHAGLAGKGEDLLCSAVSAMAQMMELGIQKVLGLKKNWKKDQAFSCWNPLRKMKPRY